MNEATALAVKIMATVDTIEAQYSCTRQEARYYCLGYAEAHSAGSKMIDILREMIIAADES